MAVNVNKTIRNVWVRFCFYLVQRLAALSFSIKRLSGSNAFNLIPLTMITLVFIVALLVFAYMLYVLIKPEKF